MRYVRYKITLDQPATYEISVPGRLDESWLQLNEEMAISVEGDGDRSVTTLTGALDQAALQGLLRQLYSLGLPLISVNYVHQGLEDDSAEATSSA